MNMWPNDLLNRKADADLLTKYLVALHRDGAMKERSYVLNIDASWGQGKTYFMTNWAAQLKESYRVAMIDAWATDYAEDPLIAVISELIKLASVGAKASKTAKDFAAVSARIAASVVKHTGVAVLNRTLGEEGKVLVDKIGTELASGAKKAAEETLSAAAEAAGKQMFARFEGGAATLSAFKKQLGDIVRAEEKPLFVFIDELDRCRPSYAIAMLERIKHIFEVPGIVFVIATDTNQLSHSIGVVYGQQFDGRGYLHRFFDRRYVFAEPDTKAFIQNEIEKRKIKTEKWNSPPDNEHFAFLAQLSTDFNLRLREIIKVVDLLATATLMWEYPVKLQILYLAPLAIGFVKNEEMWSSLSGGQVNRELWGKWARSNGKMTFKGWQDYDERVLDQSIRISEMLSRLLSMSVDGLESRGGDVVQRWLWDVLDEERRLLHAGGINRGQTSITRVYPEYVRMMANLSDPGVEE